LKRKGLQVVGFSKETEVVDFEFSGKYARSKTDSTRPKSLVVQGLVKLDEAQLSTAMLGETQ
jgi:hypothetical protein